MLLVTGITGHSGRFFLEQLIQNNYTGKIKCIVRKNSNTNFIDECHLNIEKCVGSLDDKNFLEEAFEGVDTVFHIASIFYSKNVVEVAIVKNIRRLILVHTTGIFSKYKSASKEYLSIENAINEMRLNSKSEIGITILRPTMIYGNIHDQNMIIFIKMVDKLKLFPVINNGDGLLQPVNGRDLGKGYYQLLMKDNIIHGDYVLSGKEVVSMKQMFTMIGEIMGKKTLYLSFPMGLSVFMAKVLYGVTFGKVDYIEKVLRMGENRNFSHDKASTDFGYNPMPLKQGLEIEITQYNKSKKG